MAGINMPEKKDSSGQIFQALQAVKSVYDMKNGATPSSTTGPTPSSAVGAGSSTAMQRRLNYGAGSV